MVIATKKCRHIGQKLYLSNTNSSCLSDKYASNDKTPALLRYSMTNMEKQHVGVLLQSQ